MISSRSDAGDRTAPLHALSDGFRRLLIRSGLDRELTRVTRGASPASLVGKLPPHNWQYPRPTLRRVTRDGISFELDVSDFMDWLIYFGVAVEPRDKLLSLIHPGDVVLDIGTNIGEVALAAAKKVGPRGRVIGFEPSPAIYRRCKVNLELNRFAHLEVLHLGLGDEHATVGFYVPTAGNSGGSRVVGVNPDVSEVTNIRVVPLDDLMQGADGFSPPEHIDFLKLDVEGYETKVLNGARRTLAQHRPTLFVELSDSNLRDQGSSARDLVELLETLGYQLRSATNDERVTSSSELRGCHFDVICTA